jgi:DNA invertase Pin-like site-specific DNA recombinase
MGEKNRKCVAFARASTPEGVARQVAELRAYAERAGIELVEQVEVVGSSGEAPCSRAVHELIERRKFGFEFEALMVTSLDRLVRGMAAGVDLELRLREIGVRIMTLDAPVPNESLFAKFSLDFAKIQRRHDAEVRRKRRSAK